MIELLTMLLSTVGPAGLGSGLKIVAGLIDSWSAASETREKRELVRELENKSVDNETLKIINGQDGGGRINRRIALCIGMFTFAVCEILCVCFPSAPIVTFNLPENLKGFSLLFGLIAFPSNAQVTVVVTSGHLALMGYQMMSLMFGFYFTPGGRK